MLTLKKRLSSTKDDDQLYGDLLATKMRKLTKITKLQAKHEIDNIMFKFQLQDETNTFVPQQRNTNINEMLRSPPPTPLTPLKASSPVYQPQQSADQMNLPDINSFRNFHEPNHQNQSRILVNMLNSQPSQDQMTNGDLFRRMREGEND